MQDAWLINGQRAGLMMVKPNEHVLERWCSITARGVINIATYVGREWLDADAKKQILFWYYQKCRRI